MSGTSFGHGMGSSGQKRVDLHHAVEAKLALCTALSHLFNMNYAKAAQDFLQSMSAAALAPWTGNIVSVGDIGVYATLCALATLGRNELKSRVLEGEGLAGEGEGMKELLDAWMASNFRVVLELLERSSVSALRCLCFSPLWMEHPSKNSRLVICWTPCSVRTSRTSLRSSVPARSCCISSHSRRFGSSA